MLGVWNEHIYIYIYIYIYNSIPSSFVTDNIEKMKFLKIILFLFICLILVSHEINNGIIQSKNFIKEANLTINLKDLSQNFIWFKFQDVKTDQIKISTFYQDNNNNIKIYHYKIPLSDFQKCKWIKMKFTRVSSSSSSSSSNSINNKDKDNNVFSVSIGGINQNYYLADTILLMISGNVNLSFRPLELAINQPLIYLIFIMFLIYLVI